MRSRWNTGASTSSSTRPAVRGSCLSESKSSPSRSSFSQSWLRTSVFQRPQPWLRHPQRPRHLALPEVEVVRLKLPAPPPRAALSLRRLPQPPSFRDSQTRCRLTRPCAVGRKPHREAQWQCVCLRPGPLRSARRRSPPWRPKWTKQSCSDSRAESSSKPRSNTTLKLKKHT